MRIIAGSRRGAKLTSLNAANTRPTANRVRESLFNILDAGRFGQVLRGALVIDAFAGTGSLGLEALSRGAKLACFIEQDPAALLVLRANIRKLDMQSRSHVIAGNATSQQRQMESITTNRHRDVHALRTSERWSLRARTQLHHDSHAVCTKTRNSKPRKHRCD